jgi:hypothetical protein
MHINGSDRCTSTDPPIRPPIRPIPIRIDPDPRNPIDALPPSIADAASHRAADLAHDRSLAVIRPCQLRHHGDVEQGPASTPTL